CHYVVSRAFLPSRRLRRVKEVLDEHVDMFSEPRFREKCVSANRFCADLVLPSFLETGQNDPYGGSLCPEESGCLNPAHSRHDHVYDDEVRLELANLVYREPPRGGSPHHLEVRC